MTTQTVKLLETAPDMGRRLTPEERQAAAALRLPVWTIGPDRIDMMRELNAAGAFGGLLLDGLLVHEIKLAGRTGIRLLGPGDVVANDLDLGPMILDHSGWHSAAPTRMALFDGNMFSAFGRWPGLMVELWARGAQQVSRLTAQLMICQLSRVEDRVLALLWLLAESWGKVTATGTRVPLDLTHEAIGMMVGARRPTVSLALAELAEQGAVARQRDGWLLLGTPPGSLTDADGLAADFGKGRTPGIRADAVSPWLPRDVPPPPEAGDERSAAALHEALAALQAQHQSNVASFEQRLRSLQSARERCEAARRRVSHERGGGRPRRLPS